ncbi:MAG TPA: tetratricopeptide repeat protein [Candidatus Obscuribacterales bacterium]
MRAAAPSPCALGKVYAARGKMAEAEKAKKRALAIVQRAYGPEHPAVANCLEEYAELLRQSRRHQEGSQCEERARAIRAAQGRKL